jgi:hypothetical protein
MSARQTPNSCRNSNTSIMLSSNSTPIYVKTDIIAQNAATAGHGLVDGASDTMWAVKVTRSSKEALVGERRMRLLVSSDGRILWASPASPAALFGLEPSALVGQKLQGFIDLFAEYCSGEAVALVTCTAPGNVGAWSWILQHPRSVSALESAAANSTQLLLNALHSPASQQDRVHCP